MCTFALTAFNLDNGQQRQSKKVRACDQFHHQINTCTIMHICNLHLQFSHLSMPCIYKECQNVLMLMLLQPSILAKANKGQSQIYVYIQIYHNKELIHIQYTSPSKMTHIFTYPYYSCLVGMSMCTYAYALTAFNLGKGQQRPRFPA